MDEFVKKLYDFKGIYSIFWSQNSHWIVTKTIDLILIVRFDLSKKTDIYRYFIDISPIFTDIFSEIPTQCAREIKSRNFAEIFGISDISMIFLIFLQFFCQPTIG